VDGAVVGFIILLCLAGIAAGIYLKQFPSTRRARRHRRRARSAKPVSSPSPGKTPTTMPPELAALSAPETFAPDDLFNKIDGKADLYLTAGSSSCTASGLPQGGQRRLDGMVRL